MDRITLIAESSTPTNSDGEKGEMRWDADFLYLCIDERTWKKIALVAL